VTTCVTDAADARPTPPVRPVVDAAASETARKLAKLVRGSLNGRADEARALQQTRGDLELARQSFTVCEAKAKSQVVKDYVAWPLISGRCASPRCRARDGRLRPREREPVPAGRVLTQQLEDLFLTHEQAGRAIESVRSLPDRQ
jgi:hypothetical protein